MQIKRHPITIRPDNTRVLLRPFDVSDERRRRIITELLSLEEDIVNRLYTNILLEFKHRHRNPEGYYLERSNALPIEETISETRKKLIGSYFTMEYSVESAALFNPSIIWHPDQSGINSDQKKFILSLRATGEGHISSIVFRTGIIDNQNNIELQEQLRFTTGAEKHRTTDNHLNNYEMSFSPDTFIDERIIFPYSPAESNGVEDARFVEFRNEVNEVTYYATYTAYNGKEISPKLIETKDFLHFRVNTLCGTEVKNKGFALFPQMINGSYVMISRQDSENIFIMYSDDLYNWNKKEELLTPRYPWELVQLGNCGSPIETSEGWLVLSHGVGYMRKYSIGAFLLDKQNPSKVIGRLADPIISPDEKEREGYVPNVVYSCGGIIMNDTLIIPYAMSDCAAGFASVKLNDIFNQLI